MEQQGPESAGAALLDLVWRRRRMSLFLFLRAVEHARGLMGPAFEHHGEPGASLVLGCAKWRVDGDGAG